MGFRRRAGGGRRDTAEQPIVDALRAIGAIVRQIGGTGNPDLIVACAQSEQLVRSWWEQAGRLDFSNRGAQQTANSRVYINSATRIVGTHNGRV